MTITEKLRALRADKGMSQEQLSNASGVALPTLRGIEQGRRLPAWPTLQRLVKALGASLGDFDDCEVAEEKTVALANKGRPPKSISSVKGKR